MRSQLAAATLILAVGFTPAFAQSTSPDPVVTTPTLPGDVKPESTVEAKAGTKAGTKTVSRADARRAARREAKVAKAEAKSGSKSAAIPSAPSGDPLDVSGGRNVTATGKTMPPTSGRPSATPVSTSTSTEAAMLKAQKAAEERNKAWDSKMRRTMSTICNGC